MRFADRIASLPWWVLLPASVVSGLMLLGISASMSPWWALAAVIGVAAFLYMIERPHLGLCFTAAVVPLERLGRLTDDNAQWTFSLMRLIGLTACAALILHNLARRKGFYLSAPFYLYAIYTTLAVFSVAYSSDFTGSVRACGSILANLMFLFLVSNLIDHERRALQAIIIWLCASTAVAAYSIYDWHLGSGTADFSSQSKGIDPGAGVQSMSARFTTVWQDRAEWDTLRGLALRRSMGTTSHAAVYGINLVMTIPFLLLIFGRLRMSPWVRVVSVIALGMILYNTLLTNTRAVILLDVVVIVGAILRGLLLVRWQHIVAAVLLAALALPLLPVDIYNRIFDPTNYTVQKSSSIRARQEYAVAAMRAIGDHFFFGVGVGNENEIPKYLSKQVIGPKVTSAHNEYLQTFMEVGVGGWVIFLSFVGLLFSYAVRAAINFKQLPDKQDLYWLMIASQLSMLAVLLFGMQVDVLHFPLKGWWLIAGITTVMYPYSQRLLAERGVDARPAWTRRRAMLRAN